jgi:hypothetical protein
MKYRVLIKGSIQEIDEKTLLEMLAQEVKDKSFVGLVIDRSDGKGTVVIKRKGG